MMISKICPAQLFAKVVPFTIPLMTNCPFDVSVVGVVVLVG
jgi:hypothetical protein